LDRPPIRAGTTEEHCESAKRVVENSCTNNPTLETQLYGYGNHECSAPQSEEKPALDTLPVFVLSQAEDPDSERSYSIVKRLFVAYVPGWCNVGMGSERSCHVLHVLV
jgi:hypothetical protein